MITTSFWQEMGERQARWAVTSHPFFCRWADGRLRTAELAEYAGEYDHLVVAIAAAWRRAAEAEGRRFRRRATEAEDEVRLWRAFAKRVGWGGWGAWLYAEDPLPATVECSRIWAGEPGGELANLLATLWAIESLSAATSRLQLAGLLEHYGFDDGPATEYLWRRAIGNGEKSLAISGWLADCLVEDADSEAMLERVEAVHRAKWLLLDDLEAAGAVA
jgi:pyrroloquinoline quinone (PQQ) biosynthesis protein C